MKEEICLECDKVITKQTEKTTQVLKGVTWKFHVDCLKKWVTRSEFSKCLRMRLYKTAEMEDESPSFYYGLEIGEATALGILGEAKKEIEENTLPTNKFINLGDYVLVNKETLEKWFGMANAEGEKTQQKT